MTCCRPAARRAPKRPCICLRFPIEPCPAGSGWNPADDRQTRIEKHHWSDVRSLASAMAADTDVLILALDGQRSRDALLQLAATWKHAAQRPLLVSAYPGILFRFALEGMLDTIRRRSALPQQRAGPLQLSPRLCRAGQPSDNAEVTGPVLWNAKPIARKPHHPSIVFFEQPSIPVHPLQRRYLCRQLKELAQAWPDHPDLQAAHLQHREHAASPPRQGRLIESDGGIGPQPADQLQTRHPAIAPLRLRHHRLIDSGPGSHGDGVSTRIVADLGVTETLGNHFFAASGAIAEFAAIASTRLDLHIQIGWPIRD